MTEEAPVPAPAATRAVVADGADITLHLFGREGELAAMLLPPHLAYRLAGDLIQAALRRSGGGPKP